MKGDSIISNATQLWEAFDRLAKLKDEAYDKSLTEDIHKSLGIDLHTNLKKVIYNNRVSVETLLAAILNSLQPFSCMLSDLLKLFERIGAKQSDKNLRISFDFECGEAFDFDLDAFRSDVKVIETVIVPFAFLQDPWMLMQHLTGRLKRTEFWYVMESFGRIRDRPSFIDISDWLRKYDNDEYTDTLPDCPKTCDELLNANLQILWNLAAQSLFIYQQILDVNLGRMGSIENAINKLRKYEDGELESDWTKSRITYLRAESDNWCGKMVRLVAEIAFCVNSHDKRQVSKAANMAIENSLEECVFNYPKKTTVQIERLMSILNLPYWERRYELYSAWVLTQIDAAINDLGTHYLIKDGKLSFSFGGVRMAECTLPYPELSVFAELRSPAINPIGTGRTMGIQPDYTIAIDPPEEPESAMAVIECKQYKRPSKRNFVDALTDYANARPNAGVFIADYGTAPSSYRDIDSHIRNRTKIIGMVRPGTNSALELQNCIKSSIANYYRFISNYNSTYTFPWSEDKEPCLIELRWGSYPADLDLLMASAHMVGRESNTNLCTVYYGQPAHPHGIEFGFLNHDCRHGNGHETIEINKWDGSIYDILVSNYSGEEEIDTEVSVSLRYGSTQRAEYIVGKWSKGKVWHVFKISSFGIQVVNEWI